MRVGNFSVQIPEGKERDSGYVALDHGRQYTLQLGNHNYDRRCDAAVSIDGKAMGEFRINAGQTLRLERSSTDNGRFTFFAAGSSEGQAVGSAKVDPGDRGLVRVVFRVERARPQVTYLASRSIDPQPTYSSNQPEGCYKRDAKGIEQEQKTSGGILMSQNEVRSRGFQAGVTGMTGQSGQNFTTVSNLDYDPAAETTVNIRLVVDSNAPRELVAVNANPVPAPVG